VEHLITCTFITIVTWRLRTAWLIDSLDKSDAAATNILPVSQTASMLFVPSNQKN